MNFSDIMSTATEEENDVFGNTTMMMTTQAGPTPSEVPTGPPQVGSMFTSMTHVLIYLCFGLVVCFGNGLTFLAIWKSNQLNRMTDFYIASLSVADFMVGITFVLTSLAGFKGVERVFRHNRYVCLSYLSTIVISLTASLLTLVCLSVDRCISIVMILKYKGSQTKSTHIFVIATVWIVSFAYAAIPYMNAEWFVAGAVCIATIQHPRWYLIYLHPLVGTSCFICVTICYVIIARKFFRQTKKWEGKKLTGRQTETKDDYKMRPQTKDGDPRASALSSPDTSSETYEEDTVEGKSHAPDHPPMKEITESDATDTPKRKGQRQYNSHEEINRDGIECRVGRCDALRGDVGKTRKCHFNPSPRQPDAIGCEEEKINVNPCPKRDPPSREELGSKKQNVCSPQISESESSVNHQMNKQSLRMVRMIFVILVVFFICWFPGNIILVVSAYIRIESSIQMMFLVLTFLNSGLNVVIYVTMNKRYRQAVLSVLCCCCPFPKTLK